MRLRISERTAVQQSGPVTMVTAGYDLRAWVTAKKKGRPQPPPIPQRNNPIYFF